MWGGVRCVAGFLHKGILPSDPRPLLSAVRCPVLLQLSAELSTQQQQHEKVVADSACVLGELQEWQVGRPGLVQLLLASRRAFAGLVGEPTRNQGLSRCLREWQKHGADPCWCS